MAQSHPSYSDLPLRRAAGDLPAIRRIDAATLFQALHLGWRDFMANPTQLVFLAIIYPIIGLVAAGAAAGRDMMPLVWPLLSGFALMGPVAALGIYELSRRREQRLPTTWLNAFDVLRSPSIFPILGLGAMLLGIFVVWLFTARAIYDATFAGMVPASARDFINQVFASPAGRELIILGNGVGLLFAAVVLSLTVVSFPLLLDRPVGAGVALRTSLRAMVVNPGPMALWGLMVAVILAMACIPFFVGLAVAVPVLGHATWHLYRAMVPH